MCGIGPAIIRALNVKSLELAKEIEVPADEPEEEEEAGEADDADAEGDDLDGEL